MCFRELQHRGVVTEIIVHFAGFMVYDEKFEEKVQVDWSGIFVAK